MILFIFEGKKAEPRLYKTLKELFHLEIHEEEMSDESGDRYVPKERRERSGRLS